MPEPYFSAGSESRIRHPNQDRGSEERDRDREVGRTQLGLDASTEIHECDHASKRQDESTRHAHGPEYRDDTSDPSALIAQ